MPRRLMRGVLPVSALLISALLLSACSGRVELTPERKRPLPRARLELEPLPGGTRAHLEIKDLPPPRLYDARASTYLVWLLSPTGEVLGRGGELKVDGRGNAELEFNTDLKEFRLAITAEPSAELLQPVGTIVLLPEEGARSQEQE